jgi:2'-5' RNA ligase
MGMVMQSSFRGFFALRLPEAAIESLRAVQQNLANRLRRSSLNLRWVDPDNWHVTLKFLGSLDVALVGELAQLLRDAAGTSDQIMTRCSQMLAFPSAQRARVIAVSIRDGENRIGDLARRLEDGVRCHGVAPEGRPFRAHVTIGRLRTPGNVRQFVDGIHLDSRDICLQEVRLYASILRPSGAVHQCLETALLGGRHA